MERVYDMIIIGGGPGGYTAALYAARAGLDTLVLEKLSAGGQMSLTHQIDNYPGFEDGIDGFSLGEKMQQQAERFGAATELADVEKLDLQANPKVVETSEGTFLSRTVVLATGAGPRELGIPGESELVGKGVHYCASCDGMFYRGKSVVVVGGGNSAVADALQLSRVAREVTLIHRRNSLRADFAEEKALLETSNVKILWNHVVNLVSYDGGVTGIVAENVFSGEKQSIPCDGVFVSIGRKPTTGLAAGQVTLDEGGYILADETTQTSIPGVYAVGDVRTKEVRQIVTAVADGAVAVHYAQLFLAGKD